MENSDKFFIPLKEHTRIDSLRSGFKIGWIFPEIQQQFKMHKIKCLTNFSKKQQLETRKTIFWLRRLRAGHCSHDSLPLAKLTGKIIKNLLLHAFSLPTFLKNTALLIIFTSFSTEIFSSLAVVVVVISAPAQF